nr:MAG TPA: hypothetical protein [Caudoviricetes sp.]
MITLFTFSYLLLCLLLEHIYYYIFQLILCQYIFLQFIQFVLLCF